MKLPQILTPSGQMPGLVLLVVLGLAAIPTIIRAQSDCAPEGIVAWWPMEGSTTDLLGANQPYASSALSFVAGEVATGVSFGEDGYIDIAHSTSLANQRFTFEGWARPDGAGPNNDFYGSIILCKWLHGDSGYGLAWRWQELRFIAFCGDSGVLTSTHTFAAGQFYHVAATYDGTVFRLFVNGQPEGELNSTQALSYEPTIPWTIGANPPIFRTGGFPRTWNGVLDEISIYSRALTQTEIAAIHAYGSAGKGCQDGPPHIVTQPQDTASFLWSTTSLSVGVLGTRPLSYQWRFQGATLPAGTNATLTLSNLNSGNAGSYQVIVTNTLGAVTSVVAQLTVVPPTNAEFLGLRR